MYPSKSLALKKVRVHCSFSSIDSKEATSVGCTPGCRRIAARPARPEQIVVCGVHCVSLLDGVTWVPWFTPFPNRCDNTVRAICLPYLTGRGCISQQIPQSRSAPLFPPKSLEASEISATRTHDGVLRKNCKSPSPQDRPQDTRHAYGHPPGR